ncbi:MAG TPA: class I SAM-dependent methyltransferase [Candidatus Binatia bacterium]|jgi:SAM-dependent methyltransferase|nr:class I SAM-dependent methyltransferase [Candidatus Binatia bacterium]
MNFIHQLSRVLGCPAGYKLFTRIVGGESAWRRYLSDYVKPVSGDKVLDIGCGPADILEYLPQVDYTGLDLSPAYIASARKRFGSKGRFLCNDVGLATLEREHGTFSLVMATGVLHHLDDERAAKLFGLAHRALRPGGRLITYDGCYVRDQSRIARWMLSNDRGKFVRTMPEYLRLASALFPRIEPCLRHDLLRIPYTHLIMRCSD